MKFKTILLFLLLILFSSCSSLTPDIAIVPDDVVIPTTVTDDYVFQIGRGAINSSQPLFIVGVSDIIGTTQQTFWEAGGVYVFPDAPENLTIVSTSIADDPAGMGAHTVQVECLDGLFNTFFEIINLSGTTPVTMVKECMRVNNMLVIAAGAQGGNVGEIRAVHSVGTLSFIDEGFNIQKQGVYTVPVNHTAFTGDFLVSCGRNDELQVKAIANIPSTGLFYTFSILYCYQATHQFINYNIFPFPEKTDFNVQVTRTGTGMSTGTLILEFFLVPNSYIEQLDTHVFQ